MRRPPSVMLPPAIRSGGYNNPMIAAPVNDLPAPDSPTTPSTSPGAMSKLTSSTATSVPRRVGTSMRRFSTLSSNSVLRMLSSVQLRIERVAQPVAQEIDRQDQQHQHDPREQRDPPIARQQVLAANPDQRAERAFVRRQTVDEV